MFFNPCEILMPQRVEILPTALLNNSHCTVCVVADVNLLIHKRLRRDLHDVGVFIRVPLLLYVRQGRQDIRDHLGNSQTVQAGHLVYFPKGVYAVSDFTVGDQAPFEALIAAFSPALLQRQRLETRSVRATASFATHSTSMADAHKCLVCPATEPVAEFMTSVVAIYGQGRYADRSALALLKLEELLHLIDADPRLRPLSEALASDGANERSTDIASMMEAHWQYDLRIEDYAALCGCSESTFTRRFKTLYQESPKQWLVRRRMQAAHQLLQDGRTSIQDAALFAGYESVSHFISTYKKQFQSTPKKIQKQNLSA
ncbi:helix-turn-helix transcriptional regulator [Diaphorobacter aerolatus]|uniref:Helix-turn-helix transcriptional regulator n=1 Tax=Diaphorobacter aerolatus TaxID=1288495 RepID=A0A7H0GI12_9BURK|nr:AraC family transcriptional regulator [Diaphorobacter aerolatus]QNP47928.1 helix-turn-helix transcriptional regulator [Diaphorobacter aerolatus]